MICQKSQTETTKDTKVHEGKSTIIASHAFALAADQDAGHGVGGFASLGERGVGAVPAGVVDVVAGGTSLAVTALAARSAVHNDLARAGGPVFIDEEIGGFGGGAGGLGDQSNFGCDLLQARAGVAAHGQQRQAVDFFDFAHHRENCLYGQRARFDEVGLHQRKIFAMQGARGGPVVGERGAGECRHLVRDFVGRDRDYANAAEGDDRKRDCVVAGDDEKCVGDGVDGLGNLGHVAAGFLDAHDVGNLGEARQSCGFEVRAGAAGDVVENDGLVAHGLGDGLEMAILPLLRGLVVVRRGSKDVIHPGARGDLFGFFDCIVRGVGGRAGHDRYASGDHFDRRIDYIEPFVVGERRSLAGGAAGNQKINAGLDLPCDQIAQGRVVEGTILMKGSYEGSATATELHRNRIARVGVKGNSGGSIGDVRKPLDHEGHEGTRRENGLPGFCCALQLPPDIFEVVEAFLACEPLDGSDRAFGEAAAGFGVVAEVNPVGGGFEDHFVQADHVTFAEGCDLQIFFLVAGLADYLLDRDGGAGRGVFLVDVVALENLSGVVVAQGYGGGAGYVEEEIHADREVCGVDEACIVLLDQSTDAGDVFVPSGGAHDHVLTGFCAGLDVGEDAVGSGEVDDGVDVAEVFWSERGAGSVFFRAGDADVMFALGGDFRYQRTGFAAA